MLAKQLHTDKECEGRRVVDLPERLLARYGAYLTDADLAEEQKQELLLCIWQIMWAFVEVGFSVKTGQSFTPTSEIGMDEVLRYLLADPAHETTAHESSDENEEACDS